MKVLFLCSGSHDIGGTETLACRLARRLQFDGHNVAMLFRNATPIQSIVPKETAVFSAGKAYDSFINQSTLQKFLVSQEINDVELVVALDSFSAVFAPLIAYLSKAQRCIPIATNWVPDYFAWANKFCIHPYFFIQKYNFRNNYTPQTTLSMLQKYVQQGQMVFGTEWDATIFPIPIDCDRFSRIKRTPVKGRIVSVGRLAEMKEYNLYMIEVIHTLIDEGRDIEWHVYGDGPLRQPMQDRIAKLALQDRICLKGVMDYRDYEEVLKGSHVFVGMGTALLEAAAAGVPNVVAIAYDRLGVTHGPIYRMPDNIGELIDGAQTKSVISELRRILDASDEELKHMDNESKRIASLYSEEAVMRIFYNAAQSASPARYAALPFRLALRFYAHIVSVRATFGTLLRKVKWRSKE